MDCPQFPKNIWPKEYIDNPTLFKSVKLPADFGDDETNPPKVGAYRNVILTYLANNHTYIYSSDGIPVLITGTAESGGEGTVKSVNQVLPDEYGDVELSPSDIGAASASDLATKQDTLTQTQLNAVNSGIDSTKVAQIATNTADIDGIEAKIPTQASSSNQLADKDFVNSSVATNTANYISDNGQPFASLQALEAYSGDLSNNDYAFVVGTDSAGNTTYTRYKYVADTDEWAEEYVLNNSSFTANQWASINSGITSGDVTKLAGIEAGAEANEIDSISVNGTAVTPDANKNVNLTIPEGIKVLSSADYNYPTTGTKTQIAAYLLADGVYRVNNANFSPVVGAGYATNINLVAITSDGAYKYVLIFAQGGSGRGNRVVILTKNTGSYVDSIFFNSVDSLTSQATTAPLSANMGRELNTRIGDLSTLTTTAKTSAVVAINELDSELDDAKSLSGSTAPTTATEGSLGQTYIDTSTGDMYYLSEIDETTSPATYAWEKVSAGIDVVQVPGTSTTDVMSQNAVTRMIYEDPSTRDIIKIGTTGGASGSSSVVVGKSSGAAGNGAIALGENAMAGGRGSVAFTGSTATAQGEIAIGLRQEGGLSQFGYNNSYYRLLTGLYDGQSAHDAATVGQLDSLITMTSTDPGEGATLEANHFIAYYE